MRNFRPKLSGTHHRTGSLCPSPRPSCRELSAGNPGYWGDPVPFMWMAADGQTSTQVLHSVHFSLFTFAMPSSMVMASAGHSSTQVSQPTQRSDSTSAGILVYVREKRTNRFRYSTLPSGGENTEGVSHHRGFAPAA